jgi:hypothetical protein
MGNPLIRFMIEAGRLLAVLGPFAIKNTEELENFAQQLIPRSDPPAPTPAPAP